MGTRRLVYSEVLYGIFGGGRFCSVSGGGGPAACGSPVCSCCTFVHNFHLRKKKKVLVHLYLTPPVEKKNKNWELQKHQPYSQRQNRASSEFTIVDPWITTLAEA